MNVKFPIFCAKLSARVLQYLHLGSGSTWPGEIALALDHNIVEDILNLNRALEIVIIVGTNGKTSTTKMLAHALGLEGRKVFYNATGANLLNGLASTLLTHADSQGKIDSDVALFEIDENFLPEVLRHISPRAIVFLNIFRDQLDRYGEVDTIARRWQDALASLREATTLILNGQDPNLYFLGEELKDQHQVRYFGLSAENLLKKAPTLEADTIFCPHCSARLKWEGLAYAHIGFFTCPGCGLSNWEKIHDSARDIKSPLRGLFNRYNLSAVVQTLEEIFGILPKKAGAYLQSFKPAFGRQEILKYEGRQMVVQLSKNPVGFNQSLSLLEEVPEVKKVFLILNDNIPDGRDVSWIWDVNFEYLAQRADQIFISGVRAYDMAVRLRHAILEIWGYADSKKILEDKIKVEPDLQNILNTIKENTEKNEKLYAFPVYSGMLELRKKLGQNPLK